MKIQISLKLPIILALLLAGVNVSVLSSFFFLQLDHIVHTNLYRYGLQFNYEWAGQYWMYSGLVLSSFAITQSLTAVSVVSVIVNARTHGASSRFFCYLLLLVGTVTSIFSALLLTRLDYIVNNDLYRYGLQFSYEWAANYWLYARLLIGSIGLAAATSLISMTLVFLSKEKTTKTHPTKPVCFILIATGATAIAISIAHASSILAFIGLGLTFWGAILIYIQTEDYVKQKLLDATTLPLLATLNQTIQALEYNGKAVYLPPKYFRNPETTKAYISKHNEGILPTPEQIQEQENQLFIENPKGLLLSPPGAELTKLFENMLETSFNRIDLQYLLQNLPKLFIEELEIAQNIDIKTENSKVNVKIENSAYKNLTKKAMSLQNLFNSLGCPLSSAIACALAKASGKPIIIEKQRTSENGKDIMIEFRIVEEEPAET